MTQTPVKEKVIIPKNEYDRLKKLDQRFQDFWDYLQNLIDIREAREQIKKKQVTPQDDLFNELGL